MKERKLIQEVEVRYKEVSKLLLIGHDLYQYQTNTSKCISLYFPLGSVVNFPTASFLFDILPLDPQFKVGPFILLSEAFAL